ncbi:hypothetical protein [Tardiphaga sp.]|jgi:hypothetical protein|uniref:hypothetical protein n=1 Tax=Tardiphaga sp. TaxID=1926292 RepID=UPI0037D9B7D3
MDLQTFDVEIAKEYGLECAVLFQAIGYWARHNRSKPDRQRDGKAWMYMSRREWLEEFGYIGEGTLRSALQKLANAGLIERGNYSEGMYARTTWYTLTETGWELWLKQPKGLANSAKGFGENSQTITDTNITTTHSTLPPTPKGEPDKFDEIWKAVWKRGGGSQPRQPAARAYAAAIKSGARHEDILAAVKARIGVDKPDTVYAPMLSTWMNQRRWENEGAEPVMSAADLDAANRRLEERQKRHREQMAKLAEERSNKLLGLAS